MTPFRAVCALAFAATCWAQQYTISTVAGGAPPPTPAFASLTSIGAPRNLAVDASGNVYFTSLNCVFKLLGNGGIFLVAGNSRAGYAGDGGSALKAQLWAPAGLAIDTAGNIIIADSGNNRVREVDLNGIISTVAGTGVLGFSGDGGPAVGAQLSGVADVAVDAAGNLYIADAGNNRVRKVSSSGIITTIAGNGNASQFSATSVAVDLTGDVFFADSLNYRVREVLTDGSIVTVAGAGTPGYSGDGGTAQGAQFSNIGQIVVDSVGNVYIADSGNSVIRKVASGSGTVSAFAGNGKSGFFGDGISATIAALSSPTGVALDSSGNVFIADSANNRVRFVRTNGIIGTFAGTGTFSYSGDGGGALNAQLSSPKGVALDRFGNLFIADTANNRVREVLTNGSIGTVAGTGVQGFSGEGGNATAAQLSAPEGVAVTASGDIFIADTGNFRVREVPDGTISTVAGSGNSIYTGDGGPALAAAMSVTSVAIDASRNLYIGDSLNLRVREVLASGNIATVAGGDGTPGGVSGVAVTSAGDVYFADPVKHSVWKASAGVVTRVAGTGSSGFSGDGGAATSAKLSGPTGLALDDAGNLYISDTNNNRVRLVSASGTISTIAGNGISVYSGDGGGGSTASLSGPRGLAVGKGGIIYVADTGNNAIRLLTPISQSVLISSVVDAASENPAPLTPGKIAVIYGTGLGPSQLVVSQPVNGVFGQQLAGTTVAFRGVSAPIYYTSANQVAAIVPYEVSGSTSIPVQVSYQGVLSLPVTVTYAATAPGIFTANASGAGQAAAINGVDGTLNTAANPVKTGAYISLYATGEGLLTPGGVDGKLAPVSAPFPVPVAKVTATVGGVAATVAYAGVVPGTVEGLMQINVLIPPALASGETNPTGSAPTKITPGPRVPVVLTAGGNSTINGAVWISVAAAN